MTAATGDDQLARLSELVAEHLGLHFPPERWRDLERGIAAAAEELGFPNLDACLAGLTTAGWSRRLVEALASHLTVGESYFFRDEAMLRALTHEVLPEIIRDRARGERRLRIWSAGCASGEEPYSLAMLLDTLLPDSRTWNLTILATDISAPALRKAEAGVYGEWSLRATPATTRERFFRGRKDGPFEVVPRIRERVTFAQLNLAEDGYPSLTNGTNAMDLILCRNVLMYFRPERAAAVVHRLHLSLVEGGWLAVSPCEASHVLFSRFAPVTFPDAVLYRKGGAGGRQPGAGTPAPELPSTSVAAALAGAFPPASAEPSAPPWRGEPALGLPEPSREAETTGRFEVPLGGAPSDPQALGVLARACANQGRLAEAREWCERAIAAAKLDPAGHYLLATILDEQGEAGAAGRALRHALYLDPGFVLAHFAAASLSRRQGKHEQAGRHLDTALALLRALSPDEVLPGSDGITAGRLGELVAGIREPADAGMPAPRTREVRT